MAVTHPRGIDRSVAIGLSGEESATEERGIEVLADIKAEFDKRSRRSSQRMCRHPRLERSQEAKGYRRARFDDAFDRYLTPANDASRQTRGPQASERSSADGMGTTSDFLRPSKSIWTDAKNARNPLTTGVSTLGRIKTPSGDEASSGSRNSGNRAARFRSDIGDAYEELRERGEDDGSIPAFLRRYEICAQCGRPGGAECAYDGVVVCLHSACQRSWIDAYEESHAGAFTAIAE